MSEITFQAIIELSKLINNPKAIKEAADYLVSFFALKEEEIKKRNEFNEIVTKANSVQKQIDTKQAKLDSDLQKLQVKTDELNQGKAKFAEDQALSLAKIEKDTQELAELKKELDEKNSELQKKLIEYDLLKKDLDQKKLELEQREATISAKEEKLQTALSAIK